jgi:hypothetical protein
MIRLHKTSDSVARHKEKYEEKAEILTIAETIVANRYFSGDERYYLYVDIDNSKIRGKFTDQEVNTAIEEYISHNHNQVVKPLLNQMDLASNKKKYTPQSAIIHVKERLLRQYF